MIFLQKMLAVFIVVWAVRDSSAEAASEGTIRDFQFVCYPKEGPICPHGISVIVKEASAFRFARLASLIRCLEGAFLLGANARSVEPEDAGTLRSEHLIALMRGTGMPSGVSEMV